MVNPYLSDHTRMMAETSYVSPEFQELKGRMKDPGFMSWAATSGRDATGAPSDPAGATAHMRSRLAQWERETGGNSPEAVRRRQAAGAANSEAQRQGPPAPRGKRTFLTEERAGELRANPTTPTTPGVQIESPPPPPPRTNVLRSRPAGLGVQPGGNFSAYSPGQAQPRQNPYGSSAPYGGTGPGGIWLAAPYDPRRATPQPPAGGYPIAPPLPPDRRATSPRPTGGGLPPYSPQRGGNFSAYGPQATPSPSRPGALPAPRALPAPQPLNSSPPGGRANRYDGTGFAADGTPIPGDPRMSGPRRGHPSHNTGIDFNNPQRPGQAAPRRDSYGTSTPYGPPPPAPPSYGTPPPRRGGMRTAEFRDTDFDGTDDRDQDGPGAPGYDNPGQGQGFAPAYGPGTSDQYMQDNPDTIGPDGAWSRRPAPPPQRPPPFQATTQNFDGTTSQMPNFQQRDAFIASLTGRLGQMQQQSQQTPGMGAPQFNFPQLYEQAGQMVDQGFQNPFARNRQ